MTTYEGGCYCGEVRYRAEGEPFFKAECFCRECQYITGGASVLVMGMPADGFALTRGAIKGFTRTDIANAVTREFCPNCGTASLHPRALHSAWRNCEGRLARRSKGVLRPGPRALRLRCTALSPATQRHPGLRQRGRTHDRTHSCPRRRHRLWLPHPCAGPAGRPVSKSSAWSAPIRARPKSGPGRTALPPGSPISTRPSPRPAPRWSPWPHRPAPMPILPSRPSPMAAMSSAKSRSRSMPAKRAPCWMPRNGPVWSTWSPTNSAGCRTARCSAGPSPKA